MEQTVRERRVHDMDQGDHPYLAFADDDEQRRVVTSICLRGLDRGERVVYFADQCAPEQVLTWLRAAGTDPATALDSGRLQVTTAADSYLAAGPFDPDAMVAVRQRSASTRPAGSTRPPCTPSARTTPASSKPCPCTTARHCG
ncbi:MEDS domain-containing protein [Streptomyces sp. NPDC006552]|uniref:MEDS domain-containing protein n=1 Tax=Streptomyces sp. NPDC006552 TaxID=3157179 RepID=UPI00339F4118